MTEPVHNSQRPRSKGVYLLPNLFTTAGLFAGFYAIVAAMGGRFEAAAVAVFVAMVMDGIDGRVARLTNTQSDFGVEYDSLSDLICFGLAPALVMYAWSLQSMKLMGPAWGKAGWLAAFIYTACAALRLARFNTKIGSADKRYFQGLPSPSGAAVLAGFVWLSVEWGWDGRDLWFLALALTVLMGVLMVSNVRYYSFKEVDYKNRVSFVVLVLVVLVFAVLSLNPPTVLFAGFMTYALSGVFVSARRWRRRRARAVSAPPDDQPPGA
jgi:CDP-diacylglycerol--serine O-phosphatidyltransferase